MSRSALAVVHLASEMAPLVKVGGLGDVVGSLAAEQARRGHRVTVCVPAYRALAFPEGWTREVLAGDPRALREESQDRLNVYATFPGIDGTPALFLKAREPRDISARGIGLRAIFVACIISC